MRRTGDAERLGPERLNGERGPTLKRRLTSLCFCLGFWTHAFAAAPPMGGAQPLLDTHPGPWASLKVVDKTEYRSGHEYRAEAVHWVGAQGPESLQFVLYGPHHHALFVGQYYLLAMSLKNDHWHAQLDDTGAITIERRLVRPALEFVRTWRERRHSPASTRLDEWLGLLTHPFDLARLTAYQRLIKHSQHFRSQMGIQRLDRLGAPLLEPEFNKNERTRIVKMFGELGSEGGALWLAERWALLHPPSVKRAAAAILAQHPSKASIRVLRRCGTQGGNIARRCQLLLRRLLARGPAKSTENGPQQISP